MTFSFVMLINWHTDTCTGRELWTICMWHLYLYIQWESQRACWSYNSSKCFSFVSLKISNFLLHLEEQSEKIVTWANSGIAVVAGTFRGGHSLQTQWGLLQEKRVEMCKIAYLYLSLLELVEAVNGDDITFHSVHTEFSQNGRSIIFTKIRNTILCGKCSQKYFV